MNVKCNNCFATLGEGIYTSHEYTQRGWTDILIYFEEEGERNRAALWLCDKCSKKFKIDELIQIGASLF